MFLPLFIAILLGLVNPSHTNSNSNGGDTIYVNAYEPDNGEGCDDNGDGTDPINPTGDTGQTPPPKP